MRILVIEEAVMEKAIKFRLITILDAADTRENNHCIHKDVNTIIGTYTYNIFLLIAMKIELMYSCTDGKPRLFKINYIMYRVRRRKIYFSNLINNIRLD